MTDTSGLAFRHVTDVRDVRQLLLDIHVEVRGGFGMMDRPFYAVERFDERLSSYASRPGWESVIAYQGEEPVGYAFATPLGSHTAWWEGMAPSLPDDYVEETGTRTLALNEILVRASWRGTGVARHIHEELLAGRKEQRVTLLVNPLIADGRLQAVYEAWGYEQIATQQPFPDSPVFAAMMRPLRIA
ncbi:MULTISPECIES: GNAT family N-acetyltransferase [Streptomyces]|uniref:GNAT family N-acetyltransferase n=1 Tax=Streptomyces lonegramiae TaxID=3075524 RepID=A0ABU2X9C5_9ACTN|nr:GNAT family N-acetyltransferase [Streptomyces sp. DSM 41529]MDT0542506.1 GNAT family N-acetyltransferase [Streptomyces sp. DSM 41529]